MRHQGWEARIGEYLAHTAQQEFQWGTCDCLIFVSDAARIICGKDPMSYAADGDPDTIRSAYSSEEEAFALIKEHRGSLPRIMDLHFERVKPAFAQRGDIVLQEVDGQKVFGLVWARGRSYFKTYEEGMVMLNARDAKIAWKVK